MHQNEVVRRLEESTWPSAFDPGVVSLATSQAKDWRPGPTRWMPGDNGGALKGSLFYRTSLTSFTLTISLTLQGEGFGVASHCTCRARLCEHGYLFIQSFIKAERARASFDPTPIMGWVASVRAAIQPHDATLPTARLAVVIGTALERRQLAGDDLIVMAGMLEGAENVTMSRLNVSKLSAADQALLGVLSITAFEPVPRHEPGSFYVRTATQESAILDLIKEERAFFGKGNTVPLILGPTITPTFAWQIGDLGVQHLAVCARDGAPLDLVGLGNTGWYIDTGKQVIGRLKCDIAELRAMREAPVIRKEHSAAIIAVWENLAGEIRVSKPIDLNTVQTSTVRAKPVLTTRLTAIRFADGVQRSIPVANLTFDYDGVQLTDEQFDGRGIAARVIHGQVVQFTRDHVVHDHARATLSEAGLRAAHAANGQGSLANVSGLGPGDHAYLESPESRASFWNCLNVLSSKGIQQTGREVIKPKKLTASDQFGRLIANDGGQWFDIEMGVDLDGVKHSLEPVLVALLADPLFKVRAQHDAPWAVTLPSGDIVTLPADLLQQIVTPLVEWLTRRRDEPDSDHRLTPTQAAVIGEELGKTVDGRTLKWLRGAIRRLTNLQDEELPVEPKGLNATLRPYQLEGLRWLNALADVSMESKTGIGGVLADDMGLGKTVMTIAHILWLREKGYLFAPVLIVVPASLVGNWESELQKFAPSLSRLKFEGRTGDRASRFLEMAGVEVVITTYDLLVRDIQGLREQPFALVVTDEGQRVKNLRTKAAADIRTLLSFRVLDLSGTVLENHLGELHAHLDLAVPGLLGTEKEFAKYYRGPIEKHGDVARLQELRRKIAPFVLRRTKAVVAPDLPPKTEMVQFIELAGAQAALYEAVRLTVKADVRAAIAKHGIKKANITIFDALLKLRQVCCDPRLVKSQDKDRQVPGSAKLDELFEMIETCVVEGRRMLIFSAFAEMLKLISDEANRRGVTHQMLIGETRDRDDQVREFQEGQAPLFLLSLKAGGVGLNLTAADTVIHYDPWWNPAAQAQATDRAHRIGQDKPVFVYRLICKGTVEEKIGLLQGRKASLAAAVLGADAAAATSLQFTEADIESFFG